MSTNAQGCGNEEEGMGIDVYTSSCLYNEDAIELARLHQDPQGLVTESVDEQCDIQPGNYVGIPLGASADISSHPSLSVRYRYLSVSI